MKWKKTERNKRIQYKIPLLIFWGQTSFLWGHLYPLFWTCGDFFPMFQSQGGFLYLCASSPVHNKFLRFTSGATPADLYAACMAAEAFHPYNCPCVYNTTLCFCFVLEKCLLNANDDYRPGNVFTTDDGCYECEADSNCKLSCTPTNRCPDKTSNLT